MRRFALAFLLVLFSAFTTHAESITIKGTTIEFSPPEGFINLDGSRYESIADEYRNALDKDYKAHRLYYSAEDFEAFDAGRKGPGKFIVVMAFTDWSLQTFFKEYKKHLYEMYDPKKNAANATEKGLGFFNETDTDISVLATRKDAKEDTDYAELYMATHVVRARRLIVVVQYETHTNAERYETFKTEAVARLQSMNFPPPKADGLAMAATGISAVALFLVTAALAYGFYRFRPKKR